MIVGGGGSVTVIEKGAVFVLGVGALSVTMTVNEYGPTVVGVPVSDPSAPKLKPGGRLLPGGSVQLRGSNPPVAEKANE